jgi:periplasmic protein TonB
MGLRCFLFSSDEGTAATIRRLLADLEIQAESCPEAIAAVEKIGSEAFQIVIIDWDKQPEAGLLLAAARERKASERPITLAIVSDDPSVPKALQAGANSILRKPVVLNQANDTLKTARDLLRSRRDPATPVAVSSSTHGMAAAAAAPATIPASMEPGKEKTLRAGEFLQSAPVTPGGSFVTEANLPGSFDQPAPEPVDPLKDLEPVAASVAETKPGPPPPPLPGETRGLEWYLKTRGVTRPTAPAQAAPAKPSAKPELLGYDQTPSSSSATSGNEVEAPSAPATLNQPSAQDQKKEAELFAYIDGNGSEPEETPQPRFRLGKGTMVAALVLAACAIAAAPQAPWHPKMRALWSSGRRSLHAWLNPQPVTPMQAPTAHEDFGRAGDEYKLPVAENIPDATTDPSQIKVVPVVDPTVKKPNTDGVNPDQTAPPSDGSNAAPSDQTQNTGAQAPEVQPNPPTPAIAQPAVVPAAIAPSTAPTPAPVASTPQHSETHVPVPMPAASNPTPPRVQQPQQASAPGNIPSSLKSQMASSTPDASGNKSPEAAMQSIEPVVVPEGAERSLLSEQPAISYPANAKGQQGTVVLQVLIGRDGAVQDAKFLQGSLAFARAAIDGVRQWKFKPYTMNGRAVSVQTLLTISFKPAS